MYQQGQAAEEAAKFNAQVARNNQTVAEQNEQYAIQAGMQKAAMESMKGRQVLGRIKASQAASGIETGEGSALDVQQGAREANVLDTATVLHNAQLEAYGYRSQAANFQSQAKLREMEGSAASAAGTTGALSTLLSGAGSLGSKWAGMNKPANDGTLSLADNLAKYGR